MVDAIVPGDRARVAMVSQKMPLDLRLFDGNNEQSGVKVRLTPESSVPE